MIRLAVRVRGDDAGVVLAELLELSPAGVEERDLGEGGVEYVIYGAPGELPALPDVRAAAGDVLVVPGGTVFRLTNPGPEPARLVAVTSAGMRATIGDRTFPPPWSL